MVENKSREKISISIEDLDLTGELVIPEKAVSIIIFCQKKENGDYTSLKALAESFNDHEFATLFVEYLSESEENDLGNKISNQLLTQRIILATNWIIENDSTSNFRIGYYGTHGGTAAAFCAAVMQGNLIKAVVSQGGTSDIAMDYIQDVTAPTLIILGGKDSETIKHHQEILENYHDHKKEILVIDNASSSFEEPDKFQTLTEIAINWFSKYL